jgi:hypothetical protein
MSNSMMHWTGNPYVDIGLATILVFCSVGESGVDAALAICNWRLKQSELPGSA